MRNRASVFYANHHPGGLVWIGNTAYRNGANYNLLCNLDATGYSNDVPGFDHLMKNNLGHGAVGSEVTNLGSTNDNDVSHDHITLPVTVTTNDFLSLDESPLMQPRQPDGSLPAIATFRLDAGSDLIDVGTDIGYPYEGLAPDLGAFETSASATGSSAGFNVSSSVANSLSE